MGTYGFILGRSGTGKTALCREQALKAQAAGKRVIVLVPEQASLQMEQALCAAGAAGLMDAQVFSFRRLAYAVLSETGAANVTPLEDAGKQMVLRKTLSDLRDKLAFFRNAANSAGFVARLAEVVSEFYHCGVPPEALLEAAGKANGDESRKRKFLDLYNILSCYQKYLEHHYLTNDETLDVLAARLPRAAAVGGAMVWVDGFSGFNPQEYRVLEGLMARAEKVTFSLAEGDAGDHLFDEPRGAIGMIHGLAAKHGVTFDGAVRLTADRRHAAAEDLAHLARHFFQPGAPGYNGRDGNVDIVYASGLYDELEHAAERVKALRAGGMRLSEIALLTAAGDAYEKAARAVFARHGLPLFIDSARDAAGHPLIEYIRALTRVTARGWRYDDVFRALKTGLSGLRADEVDALENYALARGVRDWQKEWVYGFTEKRGWGLAGDQRAGMNALRERVAAAFAPLGRFARGRHTVTEMAAALYDHISAAPAAALTRMMDDAASAGQVELQREHARVWGKAVALLDTLAELLGTEMMTAAEFADALDAGFADMKAELAPPALEMALFGDARRTLPPDVKALFILGANDGVLPAPPPQNGVFSDDDRAFLTMGTGAKMKPGGAARAYEEWFAIYTRVCAPSAYLCVSCAAHGTDGRRLAPSILIHKIRESLPNANRVTLSRPTPTEPSPVARNAAERLGAGVLSELYANGARASVSRLEQFARCPFSYFARYTLGAEERAVYEVARVDLGVIFHAALERFISGFAPDMDDAAIDRLAEACVDETLAQPENEIFQSSARYQFYARRVKEVTGRSVAALAEQAGGAFAPYQTEAAITGELGGATLEGYIDRIDKAELNGRTYARVVDYKSGAAGFSYLDTYHGLRLQLLIYADAAGKLINGEAAGAFYFRVHDPAVDYAKAVGDPRAALSKAYALDGVALDDPALLAAMHRAPKKTRQGSAPENLSRDNFDRLIAHARKKAQAAADGIQSGDAAAAPYSLNGRTACAYCAYRAVCGDARPRFLPAMSEAEAAAAIFDTP